MLPISMVGACHGPKGRRAKKIDGCTENIEKQICSPILSMATSMRPQPLTGIGSLGIRSGVCVCEVGIHLYLDEEFLGSDQRTHTLSIYAKLHIVRF